LVAAFNAFKDLRRPGRIREPSQLLRCDLLQWPPMRFYPVHRRGDGSERHGDRADQGSAGD
jgi:hypothetical protein